ncbi:uncharacterized protein PFL1_05257 [Pseudozyma flocculosa PF-1]|uniref:Related to UPF0382 membrane protein C1782.12c n=2 Tax=Pseudozyma flocculosa TaxID=84751 RepID=A0A5C3F5E0_9BASI|nr:uncharacterized protein PFL1_05257 [Pseudozyma flocculosa PF-1]EPQ27335.1 hypothetical protein PFL1_05257 [Pseudozyma flocculosa PF-1]SPO39708.1 related to UPF0382 membrane protein C1782.12c [Pseudozyma flocculosa]
MPIFNMLHSFACVSGAVGVGFGAIGAHALKAKLNAHQSAAWSTATQYQLMHSLALLYALSLPKSSAVVAASYAFATGITLFSGSIYGLCLTKTDNPIRKLLGPVTPLGGISFIVGWVLLAYAKRPPSLRR